MPHHRLRSPESIAAWLPDLGAAAIARIITGYRDAHLWAQMPETAAGEIPAAEGRSGLRRPAQSRCRVSACGRRIAFVDPSGVTEGDTMAIQTIDLDRFVDGTDRAGVAHQVARACEEIGFIILSGNALTNDLLRRAFTASHAFFSCLTGHKGAIHPCHQRPAARLSRPGSAKPRTHNRTGRAARSAQIRVSRPDRRPQCIFR